MFTTDRRMISSTDARCEILLSDNGVRTYNRITDFNEEYFKSKGIDILHRDGGTNFAGLVKLADRDIIYKRVNDKNVKRAYLQLYQDWIGLDREMVYCAALKYMIPWEHGITYIYKETWEESSYFKNQHKIYHQDTLVLVTKIEGNIIYLLDAYMGKSKEGINNFVNYTKTNVALLKYGALYKKIKRIPKEVNEAYLKYLQCYLSYELKPEGIGEDYFNYATKLTKKYRKGNVFEGVLEIQDYNTPYITQDIHKNFYIL